MVRGSAAAQCARRSVARSGAAAAACGECCNNQRISRTREVASSQEEVLDPRRKCRQAYADARQACMADKARSTRGQPGSGVRSAPLCQAVRVVG